VTLAWAWHMRLQLPSESERCPRVSSHVHVGYYLNFSCLKTDACLLVTTGADVLSLPHVLALLLVAGFYMSVPCH
jgi:hypothetical protein